MSLYSSFNPADYYDTPSKPKARADQVQKPQIKRPEEKMQQKKKSLYEQAKEIATNETEYAGPDFRDVYRVGQYVAIRAASGEIRTKRGRIAEIVAKNLMYVYMEDSHKDVNNQWLADFVTDKDKILPL